MKARCDGNCGYTIVLVEEAEADHDVEIIDPTGRICHQFDLPGEADLDVVMLLARAPCGRDGDTVWAGPETIGQACQRWAWYRAHWIETADGRHAVSEQIGISDGPTS